MPYLPILTYHRILNGSTDKSVDPHRIAVSRNQFYRQCTWLKRLGFRTLSLGAYVASLDAGTALPSRTFAMTFDDGYEDVWTIGAPILKEFGFTATLFVVPGQLGGTNRWDNGQSKLMTADQIRAWEKAGHEVGAHTMQHPHLPAIPIEQALSEMSESRLRLEELIGHPVPLLAYPYGETNDHICQMAETAGFAAAFATDRAPDDHKANRYRMRRTVVFPNNSLWEIFCKAQRWYPAYQDWKRRP